MNARCLSILTLVACLATATASAQQPWKAPSENIARGAAYTLAPAPNYQHCTDPEDAKQLTDGTYTQGHFWTQKSTVGWTGANPVIVTVDLGADKPIRGASFNTAAGGAGVVWPRAIYLFVAGEDKVFHDAGDLVALSASRGLPADGYAIYRYWTDALKVHGRYVAFGFRADPYAFVDEIEIFAGDPAWLAQAPAGAAVTDIKAYLADNAVRDSIKRRLLRDAQGVTDELAAASIPDAARQRIEAELKAVAEEMGSIPAQAPKDFRAVLPLPGLDERLMKAHAWLWQAQGRPAITLWQSPLWESLTFLADAPKDSAPAVSVSLMANEFRAGAFNISNAGDTPENVHVRVDGLPGGPNPPYVAVYEVAWTDTKEGTPVAAALVPAARDGEAYRIAVPSGMTRQVWMTFHPTDLPAGAHAATIEVASSVGSQKIPLTLHVYPVRFPDQPTLHMGGWDYTDGEGSRGVTADNKPALIEHLRQHFVDSPWATSAVMPAGTHDAQGNITAEPSTARFDAWCAQWPGAQQYLVFSAVGARYAQWDTAAPQFEVAVKAWATFWAKHAQAKGIRPEQIGLLLVDEPSRQEQDAIILAWAKAIRAANTGLRVWEDPIYDTDMAKANQDMIAACHVLCPNRQIFLAAPQAYRDYFVARRDAGTQLDFYSCSGPAKALDPYAYYRLQAWTCWQYQAKAMYFWAFTDTGGGNSWNEYAIPGADFCPMFLSPEGVTAAKQMEASREGVEDYEYFVMLNTAVAQAEAKGGMADVVARARALLAEAPARVLDPAGPTDFSWRRELDRSVADAVRIEMLEAIAALTPGG